MNKRLILVTGGTRSGKSSFAQGLAAGTSGRKAFVATAEPLDQEMKDRIARHKNDRPPGWDTLEEPVHLEQAVKKCMSYDVVLIDCLTLWISNLMVKNTVPEKTILQQIDALLTACKALPSTVIMVTNELGMGIVPANRLSRHYRDLVGTANQQIAGEADEVYFLVSGMPLKLKG